MDDTSAEVSSSETKPVILGRRRAGLRSRPLGEGFVGLVYGAELEGRYRLSRYCVS